MRRTRSKPNNIHVAALALATRALEEEHGNDPEPVQDEHQPQESPEQEQVAQLVWEPPHGGHDSDQSTTVLGLEHLIMGGIPGGSTSLSDEARRYRHQVLRRQRQQRQTLPTPTASLFGSGGGGADCAIPCFVSSGEDEATMSYSGSFSLSSWNDALCLPSSEDKKSETRTIVLASQEMAHLMAQALADSLYQHPTTTTSPIEEQPEPKMNKQAFLGSSTSTTRTT